MIIVYILLGFLLLLCLLSLVRIGAWVEYSQTGFLVKVKAGPVSVQVFPGKNGKKEPIKQLGQETGLKSKLGGSVDVLKQLLPVAADAAGQLKRKIVIRKFQMDVLWGDPDPARCAIGFGAANGLIGILWPPVEQNFRVKDYRIRTDVDFNAAKPTVYLQAEATLRIGQGISLVLREGKRFLEVYRQVKPETMKNKNVTTQEKEAV